MAGITTRISDKEITDLAHGLVLAMKELDKYTEGSDRKLADRLEVFLERIKTEQNSKPKRITLRKGGKIPRKK